MATKNQAPAKIEDLENQQDTLAALNPSVIHIAASLVEIVALDSAPPESLLPQRIKHARTSLVLSIEALSRLTREYDHGGAGLSPTSISRYESGEALPGLREFRLIAESLDVPVEWLLYGAFEEKQKQQGFSTEERALIHSFRNFVGAMKDDAKVQNPTDTDWLHKQARMEKLNRARKPPQKNQSN